MRHGIFVCMAESPAIEEMPREYGVLGWQWHQLYHMQTIGTSLQTDNHTNTSSLNFYRPGALPDAQPTVSEHWRHNNILLGWTNNNNNDRLTAFDPGQPG